MFLSRLASPLPGNHSREWIFGGKVGTAQTISRMRDLVTQGKRDFRIRTQAGQLCRQCSQKDYLCYARGIFEFCRDRIQYVFDPSGVELIEAPYKILESGVADCDSIVVLLAAMLESIGFPCEFVTIKADLKRPDEYSHVFLRCKVAKHGWTDMDATMQKPFGWGPPANFERKTWAASNDRDESHEDDAMAGFGQLPGLEYGKGEVTTGWWNWRNEAAAVTGTPEQLELDPLAGKKPEMPVLGKDPTFFTAEQAPVIFSQAPVLVGKPAGSAPGQGVVVDVNAAKKNVRNAYILAGALGVWLIWRIIR